MPKEVIESTGPLVEADGKLSGTHLAVSVAWGRDERNVQIATFNPAVQDQHSAEAGWYVDLGRDAINRLIRALRRSRDQAFGRDE